MKKYIQFQEFVSFLKNNKVYKEYRKNCSIPSKDKNFRDFYQNYTRGAFSTKILRTNLDYLTFLSAAFKWSETKEGWIFWKNVKGKWHNKYFD